MSPAKEFLFAHYGWCALAVAAGGLLLSVTGLIRPETLYGVIGGAVSFAYFVQKQKLEETSLFRQLFDRFNERYDAMNERLVQIVLGDASAPLTSSEFQLLIDYFNLCAEEYLYFRRGYIPRDVWRSWSNGMLQYYANPRIRTLWDKELEAQSYYGFRITISPVAER